MKAMLKRLLPLCLMTGILVNFCKPSWAGLSAQVDWIQVDWNLTEEQEADPGPDPITVTSSYYVANSGFGDATATIKSTVYPYGLTSKESIGSDSKDVLVSPRLTVYDSQVYTVLAKLHHNYTVEDLIFEKVFPTNVLYGGQVHFPFVP